MMTQLHCIPASMWGWNYGIETSQGTARIELKVMKDEGEIVLPDESYTITHPMLSGEWALKQDSEDSMVAQAQKPNPLRRKLELTFGTQKLVLQAVSPFQREFQIRQSSQVLGRIRPDSFSSRQATIEVDVPLDLKIQLFLFWLTVMLWRQGAS
ncbi:hypothetical protein [Acaryochloris sp. CCMEE 5410]|uniref:hypothetical protein n=1 Tax=Acaryochloris sp. CCMEE 5410 TaxID=310037 RepID=UPI0002EAA072|nr:hypothetical protein [Acaryochloris sp. CCMEE 5410]KAI9131675.1 hypothetical protein ON05_029285 [Acaryochloris sp. CCMEE 5410]